MVWNNFNITCIHTAVLVVPFTDDACDGNNTFLVQAFEDVQDFFRFGDQLGCPVEIPQDNESEIAANFPDVLHPAAQPDGFTGIRNA